MKRWWTKELTQLRRHTSKLGRQAYELKDRPEHAIHKEHKRVAKKYASTLEHTKKQHWRDWLEKAEDPDIWTVNRAISSLASDGRKVRIPMLKPKVRGQEETARTNREKSMALTKCFFPPKPQEETTQSREKDKKWYKVSCRITCKQVQKQLCKL